MSVAEAVTQPRRIAAISLAQRAEPGNQDGWTANEPRFSFRLMLRSAAARGVASQCQEAVGETVGGRLSRIPKPSLWSRIDNLGSWYRHYKIYASSQDLGHVSARQITARRFPSMLTCPGYRVAMDGKAPGVRCLRFDCRFAFLRFLRHFLFKLAAQSSRHGQASAKPQCSIYVFFLGVEADSRFLWFLSLVWPNPCGCPSGQCGSTFGVAGGFRIDAPVFCHHRPGCRVDVFVMSRANRVAANVPGSSPAGARSQVMVLQILETGFAAPRRCATTRTLCLTRSMKEIWTWTVITHDLGVAAVVALFRAHVRIRTSCACS